MAGASRSSGHREFMPKIFTDFCQRPNRGKNLLGWLFSFVVGEKGEKMAGHWDLVEPIAALMTLSGIGAAAAKLVCSSARNASLRGRETATVSQSANICWRKTFLLAFIAYPLKFGKKALIIYPPRKLHTSTGEMERCPSHFFLS